MFNKIKKVFKKFETIVYPLVALILIISAWLIFAAIIKSEIIIPSFKETISSFFSLLIDKKTYEMLLNTLLRTLITFIIATTLGIGLGIISHIITKFGKIFSEIIRIMRAIPTISVILLIIVWADSIIAPIIVSLLIILPIIYSNIFDAIKNINSDILRMCKIYAISNKDIALKVYIPTVLPTFFDTAKATVSLALKVIISAEVLAQTKNSIGIMMQINKAKLETASLLAWTFWAIVLSIILELLVDITKKCIIKWEK